LAQGMVEAVCHGLCLGHGYALGPLWLLPAEEVLVSESLHLGHCFLDIWGHCIFSMEEDVLSGVVDMAIMNRAGRHARAVESVVERASVRV